MNSKNEYFSGQPNDPTDINYTICDVKDLVEFAGGQATQITNTNPTRRFGNLKRFQIFNPTQEDFANKNVTLGSIKQYTQIGVYRFIPALLKKINLPIR